MSKETVKELIKSLCKNDLDGFERVLGNFNPRSKLDEFKEIFWQIVPELKKFEKSSSKNLNVDRFFLKDTADCFSQQFEYYRNCQKVNLTRTNTDRESSKHNRDFLSNGLCSLQNMDGLKQISSQNSYEIVALLKENINSNLNSDVVDDKKSIESDCFSDYDQLIVKKEPLNDIPEPKGTETAPNQVYEGTRSHKNEEPSNQDFSPNTDTIKKAYLILYNAMTGTRHIHRELIRVCQCLLNYDQNLEYMRQGILKNIVVFVNHMIKKSYTVDHKEFMLASGVIIDLAFRLAIRSGTHIHNNVRTINNIGKYFNTRPNFQKSSNNQDVKTEVSENRSPEFSSQSSEDDFVATGALDSAFNLTHFENTLESKSKTLSFIADKFAQFFFEKKKENIVICPTQNCDAFCYMPLQITQEVMALLDVIRNMINFSKKFPSKDSMLKYHMLLSRFYYNQLDYKMYLNSLYRILSIDSSICVDLKALKFLRNLSVFTKSSDLSYFEKLRILSPETACSEIFKIKKEYFHSQIESNQIDSEVFCNTKTAESYELFKGHGTKNDQDNKNHFYPDLTLTEESYILQPVSDTNENNEKDQTIESTTPDFEICHKKILKLFFEYLQSNLFTAEKIWGSELDVASLDFCCPYLRIFKKIYMYRDTQNVEISDVKEGQMLQRAFESRIPFEIEIFQFLNIHGFEYVIEKPNIQNETARISSATETGDHAIIQEFSISTNPENVDAIENGIAAKDKTIGPQTSNRKETSTSIDSQVSGHPKFSQFTLYIGKHGQVAFHQQVYSIKNHNEMKQTKNIEKAKKKIQDRLLEKEITEKKRKLVETQTSISKTTDLKTKKKTKIKAKKVTSNANFNEKFLQIRFLSYNLFNLHSLGVSSSIAYDFIVFIKKTWAAVDDSFFKEEHESDHHEFAENIRNWLKNVENVPKTFETTFVSNAKTIHTFLHKNILMFEKLFGQKKNQESSLEDAYSSISFCISLLILMLNLDSAKSALDLHKKLVYDNNYTFLLKNGIIQFVVLCTFPAQPKSLKKTLLDISDPLYAKLVIGYAKGIYEFFTADFACEKPDQFSIELTKKLIEISLCTSDYMHMSVKNDLLIDEIRFMQTYRLNELTNGHLRDYHSRIDRNEGKSPENTMSTDNTRILDKLNIAPQESISEIYSKKLKNGEGLDERKKFKTIHELPMISQILMQRLEDPYFTYRNDVREDTYASRLEELSINKTLSKIHSEKVESLFELLSQKILELKSKKRPQESGIRYHANNTAVRSAGENSQEDLESDRFLRGSRFHTSNATKIPHDKKERVFESVSGERGAKPTDSSRIEKSGIYKDSFGISERGFGSKYGQSRIGMQDFKRGSKVTTSSQSSQPCESLSAGVYPSESGGPISINGFKNTNNIENTGVENDISNCNKYFTINKNSQDFKVSSDILSDSSYVRGSKIVSDTIVEPRQTETSIVSSTYVCGSKHIENRPSAPQKIETSSASTYTRGSKMSLNPLNTSQSINTSTDSTYARGSKMPENTPSEPRKIDASLAPTFTRGSKSHDNPLAGPQSCGKSSTTTFTRGSKIFENNTPSAPRIREALSTTNFTGGSKIFNDGNKDELRSGFDSNFTSNSREFVRGSKMDQSISQKHQISKKVQTFKSAKDEEILKRELEYQKIRGAKFKMSDPSKITKSSYLSPESNLIQSSNNDSSNLLISKRSEWDERTERGLRNRQNISPGFESKKVSNTKNANHRNTYQDYNNRNGKSADSTHFETKSTSNFSFSQKKSFNKSTNNVSFSNKFSEKNKKENITPDVNQSDGSNTKKTLHRGKNITTESDGVSKYSENLENLYTKSSINYKK